ncbi:MAG: hypothetical protein HQK49_18845 [Oligoflexia bacterium]|nr:hypothetical protein [Oligoflexia bacterium]
MNFTSMFLYTLASTLLLVLILHSNSLAKDNDKDNDKDNVKNLVLLRDISEDDLKIIEQDSELIKKISAKAKVVKLNPLIKNIINHNAVEDTIVVNISSDHQNANANLNLVLKKIRVFENIINGKKYYTWIGEDISNHISLIAITFYNEDMIVAQIDSISNSYSIKHIGKGFYTLNKISENHQESPDEMINGTKIKDTVKVTPELAELIRQSKLNNLNNPSNPSNPLSIINGTTNTNNTSTPVHSSNEDGSIVDLMIVYTSDVKKSSTDITAEIVNNVQYANQVLEQSCVQFRLRLVYSGEISYTETKNSTLDLTNLTTSSEVSALRSTYGADLVQMWVLNNTDVCGIGYYTLSAEYGFSVVIKSCVPTSSIHEIGHNFSLFHDRYQEELSFYNSEAPNKAAYGYTNAALKVRDIMAYNTECANSGFYCPRIPYFSTPRVRYSGLPLGIANIADSVSRLNETRVTVANYYPAQSSYDINTFNNLSTGVGCLADTTNEKSAKLSACFVASAAYGSYLDPHVQTLREFRDKILKKFYLGRLFISYYENSSPLLAHLIQHNPTLKTISKIILTPIVFITIPIVKYPLLTLMVPIALLFSPFLLSILFFAFFAFFAFAFFSSNNIYAQVASPSFDPTVKNINPAVVSIGNSNININSNSNGGKIATKLSQGRKESFFGPIVRESEDIYASNILASYNFHGLGIEGCSLIQRTSSRDEKIKNSVFKSTSKDDEYSISIAYNFLSFLSLGFNFAKDKRQTLDQEKSNQYSGIGIGLNMFKYFYLGVGNTYIKNKQTYLSDNSWTDSYIGISFSSMANTPIALRLETAYIFSPESVVASSSSTSSPTSSPNGSNYHSKTRTLLFSADSLFIGKLFDQLTLGSVNGIAIGGSVQSSDKYPITVTGTTSSDSSSGELKEKCLTITGYLMFVAIKRHLYLGPTLSINKTTLGETSSSEQQIALNIGIKF